MSHPTNLIGKTDVNSRHSILYIESSIFFDHSIINTAKKISKLQCKKSIFTNHKNSIELKNKKKTESVRRLSLIW